MQYTSGAAVPQVSPIGKDRWYSQLLAGPFKLLGPSHLMDLLGLRVLHFPINPEGFQTVGSGPIPTITFLLRGTGRLPMHNRVLLEARLFLRVSIWLPVRLLEPGAHLRELNRHGLI